MMVTPQELRTLEIHDITVGFRADNNHLTNDGSSFLISNVREELLADLRPK
jgi:hypothetical protein